MEVKVRNIIIAKISSFFGFCPQCNSDAPDLDNCIVCENNRNSPFNKETKLNLWDRYKQVRKMSKYNFNFEQMKTEFKKAESFKEWLELWINQQAK